MGLLLGFWVCFGCTLFCLLDLGGAAVFALLRGVGLCSVVSVVCLILCFVC